MAEKEDFELYFKRYYIPLCCYAFGFIKDKETCRDLVNDAFESVWCHMIDINSNTIGAYLYTNVRNKCIDHLRRQGYSLTYLEYMSLVSSETVERIEEEDDELIKMKQVIERLPLKTRYILEECFLNEKKYKEVAEEQGISVSAVTKHIIKALKILRNELNKKS
ncbi:MAG: RNA polymerase sigma-70 factor [Bacteroides sp.]|nr:RNA polymerase sigma-70 factor [Bacteroides sp.]